MAQNNPKLHRGGLWLYGVHAVREAWLNEGRHVRALYVTEQAYCAFEDTIAQASAHGIVRPAPSFAEKQKIDKLLPKGAVHQGIALSCDPLEEMDERDLAIRLRAKETAVIAMLDQVTDPHNIGAILRSAAAFGVDGVVMQKKHAPALDGVLAKTACGALEHIPVAQATNLNRALEHFQEAGFTAVALDEHAPDRRLISAYGQGRILLVFGAEGVGIRRYLREKCDASLSLPTQGPIASLNVSNAAAVAFYAVRHAPTQV